MDRRVHSKLDPVKDQIIEGYNNGFTMQQLGDLHSVSLWTIRRFLIKHGVLIRGRSGRKRKFKKL